jgi:hypothetical protein
MPAFLSPLFLVAIAAAAIPIVLHLLKRDPEPRVKFAAVALLRQAPVERTSTRRLRQILLLLLRVAVLVLLALAFARPFLAAIATRSSATIVALDTSYSLSGPGRFARAQELAGEAIRRAPVGNDVAVIMFADRAEVIAAAGSSRSAAIAAIDAATVGAGGTRYLAAINAAARTLGRRAGTIVVVTDLQAGGWDAGDHASIPERARVEVRDAGAAPDNFAVTALRTEGDRVVVAVRNDSARTRETTVRLQVDGHASGERSVSIVPHGVAEAMFPGGSGHEAAASVIDRDGLQADNVRYALLNASSKALLIVTATGDLEREAFYLKQAVASAAPADAAPEVVGVAASQLGTSARLERYSAVLLVSTRGLDRRGRDLLTAYVAGGGGILIAAGPDVDGDVAADVLGPAIKLRLIGPEERGSATGQSLAPADVRHPIFQSFGSTTASLGLVRFTRVATIAGNGCQLIAKFTSGASAAIDCVVGSGRALVLASDLNNVWNDFGLRATFVPFLDGVVRYLSSTRSRGGDYLVGEVPAGVPATPGIFSRPGNVSSRLAVNVDLAESDPARISADEFATAVTPLKDAGAADARASDTELESRQHLWQFLLAAAMIGLAVEGFVAGRTV